MKTAVAYARYSSDNQREESITAQLRAMYAYSEKENIKILKEYVDEAESAKTDNRPYFLRMIDELSSGKIKADFVLVHKLDRFARNRYDSAIYRKKIKDANMRLIAVSQPMDDSPESVILESTLEAMAEYYSLNLGREVMKGLKENAYRGKHTGGTPPLGYNVDPQTKQYVLNEREADIVRLIYDMVLAGNSYSNIIDECNAKGYKTKWGKPFGKNSIYSILKNEKYTGLYIFNKLDNEHNGHKCKPREEWIVVENAMPIIIEKEKWDEVQNMLNNRTKQRNRSVRPYVLTGKVICGECGGSYVGSRTKGGNGEYYYFYLCSDKKRLGQCTNLSIRAEYLESYVLDRIQARCYPQNEDDVIFMVNHLMTLQKNMLHSKNHEAEYLKKELARIETKIKKYLDAFETGSMMGNIVSERLALLETEKNTYLDRLKDINEPQLLLTPKYIREYYQKNNKSLTIRDDVSDLQRIININTQEVKIIPGPDEPIIDVKLKNDILGYYGSGGAVLTISETITRKELYHRYKKNQAIY